MRRWGSSFRETLESAGASPTASTRSCRVSAGSWDPTGAGVWAVRASYGLFYDQFQNGAGAASQVADERDAMGAIRAVQRRRPQLSEPVPGPAIPGPETFVRPSTVFALDPEARPPVAQNWNLSIQRSLFDKYLVEVRYVGASGRDLPRNVEANPAVFAPGATAQNADRRRIYADCPADGSACALSTVAMLRSVARSSYHAGQASVSRRFRDAVAFNASYWFSKSLDHLSAMNLSGAAAKPLAGENDLAQNPFDLDAEWGPSLFDARHRFVASASWTVPRLTARAGSRSVGARRLAGQRDCGAQFGHAVHGL